MIRRAFLKLFGGATAAAAVTVGPKVAEAVQRAKEEPITQDVVEFAPRVRPRKLSNIAFYDDLLYELDFKWPLKRSDLLRLDGIAKSVGAIPADAVLELVFMNIPNQCVMIFRYRHDSFPLVRGCDVISCEAVDWDRFKRFFRR